MGLVSDIEKSLINLLDDALPITVEAFPDNPASWHYNDDRGTVLVQYKGGDYDIASLDNGIKKKEQQFEILLLSRDLRGHQGSYELLDQITTVVVNNRLDNAIADTQLVNEKFVKYDEALGLWYWVINIKVLTYFFGETPSQGAALKTIGHGN